MLPQILVHLRGTRMNGIPRAVGLFQNQLPKPIHIGHTNLALHPQNPIITNGHISSIIVLNSVPKDKQMRIIILALFEAII